jgi:hypothetical protein
VDIKLGQLVTKNVTKTIQMMAVKAEQLLISDGEASQEDPAVTDVTYGRRRSHRFDDAR